MTEEHRAVALIAIPGNSSLVKVDDFDISKILRFDPQDRVAISPSVSNWFFYRVAEDIKTTPQINMPVNSGLAELGSATICGRGSARDINGSQFEGFNEWASGIFCSKLYGTFLITNVDAETCKFPQSGDVPTEDDICKLDDERLTIGQINQSNKMLVCMMFVLFLAAVGGLCAIWYYLFGVASERISSVFGVGSTVSSAAAVVFVTFCMCSCVPRRKVTE